MNVAEFTVQTFLSKGDIPQLTVDEEQEVDALLDVLVDIFFDTVVPTMTPSQVTTNIE